MKKFFYYLLWPFNWLYDRIYEVCSDYEDGLRKIDSHKVVYLVIGESWCPDDGITVCSVCDNQALADVYADDVRKHSDVYRKVYVSSYTLNNLDLF